MAGVTMFGGFDDLSRKKISVLLFGSAFAALLWLGFDLVPVKASAIIGKVTTAGGQAVPQAEVTAFLFRGSLSVSSLTNGAGDYRIPYLPAGSYSLEVRKRGFAPFRKSTVELQALQTVSINAVLLPAGR